MPENKKKWIGILIMTLGIIGFFTSMTVLNVWGKQVDQDPIMILKSFIGFSFIALGLGGGLGYMVGGVKIAIKYFFYIILIFILAGILGKILRYFIPGETLKPFVKIIGTILMIYGIQWAINKAGVKKK